jgi:hypothetical protein
VSQETVEARIRAFAERLQREDQEGQAKLQQCNSGRRASHTSDGKRLLVAEVDNNAIAVFDVSTGKLLGRVPTDWYPTAIAEMGDQLLALSGKGHGTHANPDGPVPLTNWPDGNPTAYTLGQLNGSLRVLPASMTPSQLAGFTQRVAAANNWQQQPAVRRYPPFRHDELAEDSELPEASTACRRAGSW